jgi:hypothetical protein
MWEVGGTVGASQHFRHPNLAVGHLSTFSQFCSHVRSYLSRQLNDDCTEYTVSQLIEPGLVLANATEFSNHPSYTN